jgi:dihydroorotate dehydrogenase
MIYDIQSSWSDNFEIKLIHKNDIHKNDIHKNVVYNNPFISDDKIDFLGHIVSSRIGIAAGPLLNSKWIQYAAELNVFSVLTYKTIQSEETPAHSFPNIVYIADDMSVSKTPTRTITNSFGMPSMSKEYLEDDIPKSIKALKDKQVLVLSITGKTVEDIIKTTIIAKNTNVSIIEVNLSCPNIASIQSEIYMVPELIIEYISSIKRVYPSVRVIVKVGMYPSFELLEKCIIAIHDAGADAVSGINSVKKQIKGFPRSNSGVCGELIKKEAINFVTNARNIINKHKLNLTLIGVGGIITKQDANNLLDSGADFVQCATGFLLNPTFMFE